MNRIEFFGDSIIRGALHEKGSMLRLRADNRYSCLSEMGYEIRNNARFGSTAVKVANAVNKRLDQLDPTVSVVLGFGGNDCDFDWKSVSDAPEAEHVANVPLDRFIALYRDIIAVVKKTGAALYLVNLIPLDSEKFFQWISMRGSPSAILSWLGDINLLYRWHENYSRTVERIAAETGCALIDVRSAFLTRHDYKSLLCFDGIHPTEAGYGIIDSVFKSYFRAATA